MKYFSISPGIPLTLHGRPSSRSSQRSVDGSGGNLNFSYSARRQSSGAGRGPLVPASRAGAARTAAILLISCHLQATKGEIKRHRRTLSELIERPSNNGLGSVRTLTLLSVSFSVSLSFAFFLNGNISLLHSLVDFSVICIFNVPLVQCHSILKGRSKLQQHNFTL